MGKPAVRIGDPVTCPKPGHGPNTVETGSPNVLFDGIPAARGGDRCSCGNVLTTQLSSTVLINGSPAAVVGCQGDHGGVVIGGSGTVVIGDAPFHAPVIPPASVVGRERYGQSFHVTDSETGGPLAHRAFVARVDGVQVEGMTDANGIAQVEAPSPGSRIAIHVKFRAPTRLLDEFAGIEL